ncbi:MAG: helix-turn-helix domain-containing protein [Enterocloster aldenensis]
MQERIRKLRRELDLTQQEFASRIGMKRNTVANYETGRNDPSTSVISLICREFNVSEHWLRTGEGEMFNDLDLENQLMIWMGRVASSEDDDFKKRLLYILMNLTENQWDTFEDFAKKLVLGDITDKNKKV